MTEYPQQCMPDQERWAEEQARRLEQQSEEMLGHLRVYQNSLAKLVEAGAPHIHYAAGVGEKIYQITVGLQNAGQLIRDLRQPRELRLENELRRRAEGTL